MRDEIILDGIKYTEEIVKFKTVKEAQEIVKLCKELPDIELVVNWWITDEKRHSDIVWLCNEANEWASIRSHVNHLQLKYGS